MTILTFSSLPDIETKANLEEYIQHAKALSQDPKLNISWISNNWKFPSSTIRFIKYEYNLTLHKSIAPTPNHLLDEHFINFSKAYIINNSYNKESGSIPRSSYLTTQLIEAALIDLDGIPDVTKLSRKHLDRACEIVREKPNSSKVNIGIELQKFARHISKRNLTNSTLISWRHPFTKKNKLDNTKLPEDQALLCLAEVFSNGHSGFIDDESVYLTGITAMYLAAPMRISEQAWLPSDVLKSDKDSNNKNRPYLQYYSSKFDRHVKKEITPIMSQHVKTAITRILEITNEGRSLARHYENSPNQFYRHQNCPDVHADQLLSGEQVAQALGTTIKQSRQFIYTYTNSHSLSALTLNKLWKIILIAHKRRNPHFPYQTSPKKFKQKPLKMSESLICFRASQLSPKHLTSPVLLSPTNLDHFNKRLTSSKKNSKNVYIPNFFERHGYMGIAMTSHMLRHFNNTAAQEAGLGIEVITQWSSRAKSQGSRTYMHRDEKKFAREIGNDLIPVKDVTQDPVTDAEYHAMEKGPVITTRYGLCTHAWTVSPCEKSGDCLNCSELLHCKGHKKSMHAVKIERDQVAENLQAAEKAIAAGTRAATRWVLQHRHYLERLDSILRMHSDPSIPGGSAVRMQGKDFTHAKRILSVKHPDAEGLSPTPLVDDGLYSDDLVSLLKLFRGKNHDA